MSRIMRKPTLCVKTKTQISFVATANPISALFFATRIVHFLFFLNPKSQASSHLLWLYSLICVGPVQKPHCWFSHEAANWENFRRCLSYFDQFVCKIGQDEENHTVIVLEEHLKLLTHLLLTHLQTIGLPWKPSKRGCAVGVIND